MGTLTKNNPNARELVTEVLDKTLWWTALGLIVEFLRAKNVERVRVEFGVKQQPPIKLLQLSDLKGFVEKGFEEGTIQWKRTSDFFFYPLGTELAFMLCNDADLHFASADSVLIAELGQALRSNGIKVYESGHAI